MNDLNVICQPDTNSDPTRLCVAENYSTIAGLRLGVGAGEAILQAGPLYLSFWYRRDELATRGAIFFATSAVAGAFNGIIAYAIFQNLEGVNGWGSWRWLFLIEGMFHRHSSIFLPLNAT